jgi:ATP-dependent DNA helicase RecG
MDTQKSVRYLPGVGEKTEKKLNKLGIYTVQNLLLYMPRRYRDLGEIKTVSNLKIGETALFYLTVLSEPKSSVIKKGLVRTVFEAGDKTGILTVVLFNQAYTVQKLSVKKGIYVYGRMEQRLRHMQLASPEIFFEKPASLMPVYPLTKGLTQAFLQKIIKTAMNGYEVNEPYSFEFLKKYGITGILNAVRSLHLPQNMDTAKKARDRLVFDELIVFNKILELLNQEQTAENQARMKTAGLKDKFLSLLPFPATGAQKKVMREIAADLSGKKFMNRLVQGDVGSGKTVLAFFAIYCAAQNGYQSAMMAPTEILAVQHYEAAKKYFQPEEVVLITGSQTAANRRGSWERIRNGSAKIIIGTHAILYGKTGFQNLGLIITDEQHRFGVRQRAALADGQDIHVLTMSATPIPRSLSLVLYGKTDISIVDELPPGRQPVSTYIIGPRKYGEMIKFIQNEIKSGRQAYIVCALIEEDETGDIKSVIETVEDLKQKLPGCRMALLHGRLPDIEKQKIMSDFSAGLLDIIVSTTVIEVGINVPNSTVMCILNAERFGLAQLHQLRGRVGRGEYKSYCFLVSQNQNAIERLSVLCHTADGFEIAKKDMELRGTGDVFGVRQHGEARFAVANILYDSRMLEYTKNVLNEIKVDPEFSKIYQNICIQAEEKAQNTIIEIALN